MRDNNVISATLTSRDDESKIKECVTEVGKIVSEFLLLVGVEVHKIVRQMDVRLLVSVHDDTLCSSHR